MQSFLRSIEGRRELATVPLCCLRFALRFRHNERCFGQKSGKIYKCLWTVQHHFSIFWRVTSQPKGDFLRSLRGSVMVREPNRKDQALLCVRTHLRGTDAVRWDCAELESTNPPTSLAMYHTVFAQCLMPLSDFQFLFHYIARIRWMEQLVRAKSLSIYKLVVQTNCETFPWDFSGDFFFLFLCTQPRIVNR